MRRREHPCHRPPRHSFHEGASPDSYMLTAFLIHSLKHGSGVACSEPHCHLCGGQKGTILSHTKLEAHKNTLLNFKDWKKLNLDHAYVQSICEENSNKSQHLKDSRRFVGHFQASRQHPRPTSLGFSECSESGHYESPATDVTFTPDFVPLPSSDTFFSTCEADQHSFSDQTSSCKETEASLTFQTDSATLTDFMTGRPCCTSSFFGDVSYDSGTLTETNSFDLPRDGNLVHRDRRPSPKFDLSMSVCSLPCRLGLRDKEAFERPVLSSGSLVLVPRRPSLSAEGSSSSHFRWEEVRGVYTPPQHGGGFAPIPPDLCPPKAVFTLLWLAAY